MTWNDHLPRQVLLGCGEYILGTVTRQWSWKCAGDSTPSAILDLHSSTTASARAGSANLRTDDVSFIAVYHFFLITPLGCQKSHDLKSTQCWNVSLCLLFLIVSFISFNWTTLICSSNHVSYKIILVLQPLIRIKVVIISTVYFSRRLFWKVFLWLLIKYLFYTKIFAISSDCR